MTILFKKLHPEAKLPTLGTPEAAGYDLYATESVVLLPGDSKKIPLGFAAALPEHLHGRVETRSGMGSKSIHVLAGVIDCDYRGEWMVILHNSNDQNYTVKAGDRVAQLVLRETVRDTFDEVLELPETARGSAGYGSTGR